MNTKTTLTLIAARQAALGISDAELASSVGYSEKAIEMMKSGGLNVPINKVASFAAALQVPYFDLLRTVLGEQAPELWKIISELAPLGELHSTEVNLLKHLRQIRGAREVAPVVFDGKTVIALVTVE